MIYSYEKHGFLDMGQKRHEGFILLLHAILRYKFVIFLQYFESNRKWYFTAPFEATEATIEFHWMPFSEIFHRHY